MILAEPNQPILTGPNTVIQTSTNQWTCKSTGGNPAPLMGLRIDSRQFESGITKSTFQNSDNTYTVISVLSWAPSITDDGQTLSCDVQHQETRGNDLQTASLQLSVNGKFTIT